MRLLLALFATSCAFAQLWTPLFDGESLTGWKQKNGTATYRVEGATIVGRTAEGSPNSFLCTEREYGDFILEFEVKMDARLNSGVQIRSHQYAVKTGNAPAGRVYGYQVEIASAASNKSGGIYDEARRAWLFEPFAEIPFRDNAWNHYRVEAIGDSIKTWVNGVKVADLVDVADQTGFIGLQVHAFKGDSPAEVSWRNIQIQDLGRHEWKPIFDGKTLSGWTKYGIGDWQVTDGALHGTHPGNTTGRGFLFSNASYSNYAMRLKYKAVSGNSGVFFRSGDPDGKEPNAMGYEVEIDPTRDAGGLQEPRSRNWLVHTGPVEQTPFYKQNDWNELTVIARGQRVAIFVNGHKTAEMQNDPGRPEGRFALQINPRLPLDVYYKDIEILEHTGKPIDTSRFAPALTHGPLAGDVSLNGVVLWARAFGPGTVSAKVMQGTRVVVTSTADVDAHSDFAAKFQIKGLAPDTAYTYEIAGANSMKGSFRTPPVDQVAQPVSLVWGGDVAGQNVCRDASEGFPIFDAIAALKPTFFIGLGDMIYADNICEATGRYKNAQVPGDFAPSAVMKDYWGHWKYTFGDSKIRTLLSAVPYYAIWDDHEVVNDFGPLHDTRTVPPYKVGEHLLPLGLAAFLHYNPVIENPENPRRLYRSYRWGKNVEVFYLDTRQYRDANAAVDDPARPKTLLGREQVEWFKQKVAASDALWKVIVSSVPIAIPTGSEKNQGPDGWVGFGSELRELLTFMADRNIRNQVWITTDVHFSAVFRYKPFPSRPDYVLHELATGPLNAGLFPNQNYETKLGTERLFFYGPPNGDAGLDWPTARKYMNFGVLDVTAAGKLTATVRDVDGKVLYSLPLEPK